MRCMRILGEQIVLHTELENGERAFHETSIRTPKEMEALKRFAVLRLKELDG